MKYHGLKGWKAWLAGAAHFSGFCLCNEIVFTGISEWIQGSFKGSVSLLMVPVYLASFTIISSGIYQYLKKHIINMFVRAIFIVMIIYTVEYLSGTLYFALGLEPWRYHHGWASDFSNGAITLYYAPAWYVFSFIVVRVEDMAAELAPLTERLFERETSDFMRDWRASIGRILSPKHR